MYKTYQTGFSFGRLGHATGVGLGGTMGIGGIFPKFNQIYSVSLLHNCTCNGTFVWFPTPEALGRGQTVKYHLNLNYKGYSKDI